MSEEVQERLMRLHQSIEEKYDRIEELQKQLDTQHLIIAEIQNEPPSELTVAEAELESARLIYDTTLTRSRLLQLQQRSEMIEAQKAMQAESLHKKQLYYEELWEMSLSNSSALSARRDAIYERVGKHRERMEMSTEDLRSYRVEAERREQLLLTATTVMTQQQEVAATEGAPKQMKQMLERMRYRKSEQLNKLKSLQELHTSLVLQLKQQEPKSRHPPLPYH